MLRIRYETPEGDMIKLKDQTSNVIFWAEKYDGRFGKIIFGHHAYLGKSEIVNYPYAIGIDLGCVYGGYLVALLINGNEHEAIKIKAKRKYYEYSDE